MSLHGLSLASSVLPVLTIMKPAEMRREKKDAGIIPCGRGKMKHGSGKITFLIMSKDIVFTHLLVFGPSVMLLFGVKIITGCPLAVGVDWIFVCNVCDLLIEL